MVQPQYSPEEALNRVKLMMGYDSSKTLNENKSVIFEQIASPDEYFKSIVKGYMKYPEKITINYGTPSINPKKNAEAFQTAIDGLGRDISGLDYIIGKTFNKLSDSMAMIKTYPEVAGENLYDAIDGEWFSGNLMKTIVSKISSQLKSWCTVPVNSKQEICKVKSKEEMKYGI
jgi:hypothetical protein